MLHTLIQTQPRPRPTELPPIPLTLHRTLPLIYDLRIAHETIPAVALPSILRPEIMPSLTRARAALDCHGIARGDCGGEDARVRAVCVAPLVAITRHRRVPGDGDVGVILEHGDAIRTPTRLGTRARAAHLALPIRPHLVRDGEDPRAVAFARVLEAEVRVPTTETGARTVGGIGGGGHACAEGARVQIVDEAAGVGVAGERGSACWSWKGGGGGGRGVFRFVDVDALGGAAEGFQVAWAEERAVAFWRGGA